MLLLQLQYLLQRELFVHVAGTVPQHHVAAGDAVDVASQVLVRTEDDLLVLGKTLHYLPCVAAGNHHIGQSLGGGSGVDIAYHGVAGMLLDKLAEAIHGAAFCQRALRIEVGHQHHFVGTENLVGLSHEVNTAHHDDVCISLGSLLCQSQAVTHKVGYILYVALGVVMRHDDCVLLLAHAANLSFQVCSCGYGLIGVTLLLPFRVVHIIIFS